MADFLDEKRREIRARMQELKPLVDEYHRLEAAVQALEGVKTPAATPSARRPRAASNGTGRRGRPRGSGTRGKQALELVRANPGITIPGPQICRNCRPENRQATLDSAKTSLSSGSRST